MNPVCLHASQLCDRTREESRMSFIAPLRAGRQSRRRVAFVLAVILPVVGTILSAHMAMLAAIPYSLHVLAIVAVGILGGLAPSLVTVLMVVVSRCCLLLIGPEHRLSLESEATHGALLVASAFVVWFMSRRRQISEEKLEAALIALQERTDDLVASLTSSKCACWTIDLNSGRSERWYSGSYQLFGRPYSELEEMPSLLPLVHPDDVQRLRDATELMRSSWEPVVFEYKVTWPNGEIHTLEMRGNRVAGRRCVWRGVTLDITERRKAEGALLRAEKLAAMGRLASTVAHEINNPLESVTNLLYLARAGKSMDEDTRHYLATAESELARLSNITRLTLGFVRTSASSAETEIAGVVDEVLSIFHHRFETKNVQVECHYEPGVRITIAPHELRQIATNLIANAADAVGAGDAHIAIRIAREEDKAVLLVEDNGEGIDEEHLPRIFEAFFSTKEEVGTGIGLWVTRELVEKNGGRISARSSARSDRAGAADAATQFRVEFPLAQ
jgi:PAS domain S-box-containing protein